MNKKKVIIVFLIRRENKFGNKDFDHILPFLYFLNKNNKSFELNLKGFIFDTKSKYFQNIDPRLKLLSSLKNCKLVFLFKENFLEKIAYQIIPKNNLILKKIFNKIFNFISNRATKEKSIDWKNKLGAEFIKSETPLIFTLHEDHITLGLVSQIKKYNDKAKCIILPHGTVICDNEMLTNNDMEKKEIFRYHKSYKNVDYFLRTSKYDLKSTKFKEIKKRKEIVIGSPRYCKEWLNVKSKLKLDGDNVSQNKKYKIKILFLIPKEFINIFNEELIRTIDFISSYKEIEIILLKNSFNYPVIPKSISKRKNIRQYYIFSHYSSSKLIEWADIVLHAGTGVLFESFMKNKITVLLRYLSCNTFLSEKYNAGLKLKNRDELRNLCNSAVRSLENLKKNYKKQTNSGNKKFTNEFVNGNINSVPKTIYKSILHILNKV